MVFLRCDCCPTLSWLGAATTLALAFRTFNPATAWICSDEAVEVCLLLLALDGRAFSHVCWVLQRLRAPGAPLYLWLQEDMASDRLRHLARVGPRLRGLRLFCAGPRAGTGSNFAATSSSTATTNITAVSTATKRLLRELVPKLLHLEVLEAEVPPAVQQQLFQNQDAAGLPRTLTATSLAPPTATDDFKLGTMVWDFGFQATWTANKERARRAVLFGHGEAEA
jgi:hypothetical protein